MNIVFVLVPVTLILVGIGLWGFFWAVRSGQFDELDSAAWEILVDEPPPQSTATKTSFPP